MQKEEDEIQQMSEEARDCKLKAEQGDALDQYNYAVILFNGDGVSRNLPEAARYFKLAADQGHSDAAKRLDELLTEKKI